MNQSLLSVRVDAQDKKKFESFCNKTGMNISTAINIFIKTVVREQKIPFEITTYNSSKYVESKLSEADEELSSSNSRYTSEDILNSVNDITNV